MLKLLNLITEKLRNIFMERVCREDDGLDNLSPVIGYKVCECRYNKCEKKRGK